MRQEVLDLFPLIDTFFPYEFGDDEEENNDFPDMPLYTVSHDSHPRLHPVELCLCTTSAALTTLTPQLTAL